MVKLYKFQREGPSALFCGLSIDRSSGAVYNTIYNHRNPISLVLSRKKQKNLSTKQKAVIL